MHRIRRGIFMPGIIHGTNEISWDKALIGNSTSLESIQSLARRATYNSVIFINCNRSLSLSISSMASSNERKFASSSFTRCLTKRKWSKSTWGFFFLLPRACWTASYNFSCAFIHEFILGVGKSWIAQSDNASNYHA